MAARMASITTAHDRLGDVISDVAQLEDLLSEPTEGVVETLGRLEGDLILLGVGGKLGPTLARMAQRASEVAGVKRRVFGVSRFSSGDLEERLQEQGLETVPCDLMDPDQLAALPDAPNVLLMVGIKFGTTGNEGLTWAVNTDVPAQVARRYSGCRIVAFSTGNVYGLTPVTGGGSRETDAPLPVGEYAMSALGRERVLDYYSRTTDTPMVLIRLNYAVELRYGVLVDLARWVWEERPIDLSMGWVNVIWQADANAMVLRAFDHAAVPPAVFNVAGPEVLSVRQVCEEFGAIMGRPVRFTGQEGKEALLSNGEKGRQLLGQPRLDAVRMMPLIARWVMGSGESLYKPTHFESWDGQF